MADHSTAYPSRQAVVFCALAGLVPGGATASSLGTTAYLTGNLPVTDCRLRIMRYPRFSLFPPGNCLLPGKEEENVFDWRAACTFFDNVETRWSVRLRCSLIDQRRLWLWLYL
jgi:hypothetical protein